MTLARTKDEWLAAGEKRLASEQELTRQRDAASADRRALRWLRVERRTGKPLGVAAGGALLAVLVPKCPMCLAMYLSFLGAAASWFVWLRPLGVVLTLAGLAVAAWRHLRASGERPAAFSSRSR